jgi:hypothetical protein
MHEEWNKVIVTCERLSRMFKVPLPQSLNDPYRRLSQRLADLNDFLKQIDLPKPAKRKR